MKIPIEIYITANEQNKIIECWRETARQLSMKTGVFINVGVVYESVSIIEPRATRLYFDALGHDWESLDELEKALKVKAFA